jgi:hypothetical protein
MLIIHWRAATHGIEPHPYGGFQPFFFTSFPFCFYVFLLRDHLGLTQGIGAQPRARSLKSMVNFPLFPVCQRGFCHEGAAEVFNV